MKRPYVIMQVGSSLDGRVAAAPGQETKISSPEAFRLLHGLRDKSDAVVVGRSTVEVDDPSLTVRNIERESTNQPLRVVFDSKLKLQRSHKIFAQDNYLIFHDDKLGQKGEKFVGVPNTKDGLSIPHVLASLIERGLKCILVEGGPTMWTSFLNAGAVDEIWWFQSPVILGAGGVPSLSNLTEKARMWMAAELHVSESFRN